LERSTYGPLQGGKRNYTAKKEMTIQGNKRVLQPVVIKPELWGSALEKEPRTCGVAFFRVAERTTEQFVPAWTQAWRAEDP
jgi:hypothetical protein